MTTPGGGRPGGPGPRGRCREGGGDPGDRGDLPTRRDALRRMGLALLGVPFAGVACGSGEADEAAGSGGNSPGGSEAGSGGAARTLAPLGLQLYTVRAAMAEDVGATLARVAEIGYREVELAGRFGHAPADFRTMLDDAGLTAPSTHVGVDAFDDWPAALDAATTLGHRFVVVPSLPESMRATLDDWRRTAERFNVAGEEARAAGVRVAFHNHAVEARPMAEGPDPDDPGGAHRIPLDLFLEETDPELVGVQADLFWMLEGGLDPVAFLERWPGRVETVHVKGRADDGEMVDVGAGSVDWATVLGAGLRAGVRHHFVEHDRPDDPFASIRASYEHLAALEIG